MTYLTEDYLSESEDYHEQERDLDESYTEGVDNHTPSMDELESWFNDSGCPCTGPCECWVEHDGTCPNGYPSQFKSMGLI